MFQYILVLISIITSSATLSSYTNCIPNLRQHPELNEAVLALGNGVPLFHAGDEVLRPLGRRKAERNSFLESRLFRCRLIEDVRCFLLVATGPMCCFLVPFKDTVGKKKL